MGIRIVPEYIFSLATGESLFDLGFLFPRHLVEEFLYGELPGRGVIGITQDRLDILPGP